MNKSGKCFVCDLQGDDLVTINVPSTIYSVHCSRCGNYTITREAIVNNVVRAIGKGYLLSAAIRHYCEQNLQPFHIDSSLSDITVFNEKVMPLVPQFVSEKMDRIVSYLAAKAEHPGDLVVLKNALDYPIAFCNGYGEMEYYLGHLLKIGYAEGAPGTGEWRLRLTPAGWQHLEEIKKVNKESKNVFVAMSFAPDLSRIYNNGIKPVEKETGFNIERVDSVEHNDKIDDRIIAKIRRSRFMIADVTEHRPGVYFEAGFALGLGLPVIWTCHDNDKGSCHFDTRQYNHIFWKTPDELRGKLKYRILATIGHAGN